MNEQEKSTIVVESLQKGLTTAFIDKESQSNMVFRPQFLSNDYKNGRKVLSSIEDELRICNEFCLSVAFITMSGIAPLLQTFKELEKKDIKGRILTTDYLTFSDPKALRKLADLQNIEVRMYCSEQADEGFHTKGYIFRTDEVYRIIIGSSNMTLNALTKNKEWNTRVVSTEQGEFADQLLAEFNSLWESEYTHDFNEIVDTYSAKFEIVKKQKAIAAKEAVVDLDQYKLQPNSMQVGFIKNLRELRDQGKDRALLISATGTGKTYASAFAIRDQAPKRALFLVHRELIAKQAIKSYKRVFGKTKTFGLLSGNSKDYDVDYLFATMQTMAKAETLERFKRDEFDTIIIDEVHRAGAESYQRIMNYFTPNFWLGMTASPERTDGYDIYGLFDHNIAYEIRLQQALEENMLCPFHYFGISDLEIDGEVFDDETGLRNFNRLVSSDRVDHIIKQITYYGHSGDRVKGLIFCSRKEEAKELSDQFNRRGYNTVCLTGEDGPQRREICIERLTSDTIEDKLDYIFTVDIFNEGVDIPEINQVVMLRPTESPVIFVQQLGRGLRKANDKEYVVILDFIGNYRNNFMIPIALSGDRSYNKDTIRRYVLEGTRVIPGSSTLHFDEVSRKRIFQSIDSANFNDIKLIKECYKQLKFKLGRVPELADFEKYGTIDPLRIFDNKSLGSYHVFLKKYEKDEYHIKFTEDQEQVLEYISRKFASGKRPHELIMLKLVMIGSKNIFEDLKDILERVYSIPLVDHAVANLVNVMTNSFTSGVGAATYSKCILIQRCGKDYCISDSFAKMLEDENFYAEVKEVVDFGIMRNRKDYNNLYSNSPFQLYAKYTYDDVCRLLNWEKGEVALNIGGYKYDKRTNTYPVFINYDKSEDIVDTIRYEDRLEDQSNLIAISKSNRTVESDDVATALNADKLNVAMELFVRKNKDDKISKEFYYLGRIHPSGHAKEFIMANTDSPAVEIGYELETPVREDIYDYITA